MRAGLTGLGIVFLSTLAASLVFGPSADDPATEEHVKAPGEPLAQLGVAPGIEKDKDGQPVQPEDPLAAADPALSDPASADPALADPALSDPLAVDPAVPPGGAPPRTRESPASRPMGGASLPVPSPESGFASNRPVAV